MTFSTKYHKRSIVVICCICTLLAILIRLSGTLEYGMRDFLIRHGKRAAQDPQLMFLSIDEATMDIGTLGFRDDIENSSGLKLMSKDWPWSREVYALILEKLVNAGAKVVAFDLVFPRSRAGDEEFRAALAKYKDRVVIGSKFEDQEIVNGSKSAAPIYKAPSSTLIPPPTEADDRVGYINFWPMSPVDNVIRSARYRISGREYFGKNTKDPRQVFESFPGRILRKMGHMDAIPRGEACIRFASIGSGEEFNRHSLYSIFSPRDWENEFKNGAVFKDKTVLIGNYGNGEKDQFLTPFGDVEGPLLHLSAVNAALHNDFISLPSYTEEVIMILLASVGAILLSLLVKNPLKRFGVIVGVCLAYLLLAKIICDFVGGHMLPVLTPLLAFFVSGVAVFLKHFREQRNDRLRMLQKMERYVSKNIVKQVIQNPTTFLNELGGVRKPVTVLVTDLRDFTALAEKSDSAQLVQQLNEYFTVMVRIIFERKGTVDKFIGDAILAVWGNIHSDGPQQDAENAALAAIEMQEALAELNENWKQRNLPPLIMGIGLNAGEVVFGNIGSSEKMEPTIIGDVVNLSSSLIEVTKEYGVPIALGEKAAALVGGVCHLQIVDRVPLKGKNRMIQAYTVLGNRKIALGEGMAKYLEVYKTGLVHYQAGRFREAANAFAVCLTLSENDPLAQLYRERCVDLDRNPPDHWNGIYSNVVAVS